MVEESTLLEKPFSTETLSFRVREALDRYRPADKDAGGAG
jgi:hypothetical protein